MPIAPSVDEVKVPGGPPPDLRVVDPRGQWPRMLNLDPMVEASLAHWLYEEIHFARIEKSSIVEDWKRWQKQYWAQPEKTVKDFPFKRAANFVVPLSAIAVEAVHARIMNTIWAVEPFWSVRPRSGVWIDAAKPVERFLQSEVENPSSLDAYNFTNDSLLEGILLGTFIGKSGYVREIKKTNVPRSDGLNDEKWVESRNGATLEYVPCANFLIRAAEDNIQESAWCGEEHSFTWAKMKRMALSNRVMAERLEEIKHWRFNVNRTDNDQDPAGDFEELKDELQSFEPQWHERFRIQEIWAAYDIDRDGVDEEIVIDFHYSSKTVLGVRYNWHDDLRRPYRVAQYVKVPGRIWGIGVGKQSEQFQDAITTINRQRVDNATLANMRMMAVRKMSGISPDEPIFPGKIWFVDDPDRDIKVVQLSEVYTSAFNNEISLLQYYERYVGVNEVLLGLPPTGTPGTATGDLARIAEGNKRFDLVLRNIRKWLSELGMDVASNYQQFGAQGRHFLILGESGAWVEEFLRMPGDLVSRGAVIELTATSATTNRQTEQQQFMSLYVTLQQHFTQLVGLAQLLGDPQILLSSAIRAAMAADQIMLQLLKTFDNIAEPEKFLFLTPEERQDAETAIRRVPAGTQAGGGEVIPAGVDLSRLAGLVGGAPGLGGNGGGRSVLGGLAARGVFE